MCQKVLYYHIQLLNQLGNSYLSQPGNSPKTFMFNLPYWLTNLANVDGHLKEHMQCFGRIDQKPWYSTC